MKNIIVFLPLAVACATATTVLQHSSASQSTPPVVVAADTPVYIPPSPQRSGDSARGYQYLVTGDYIRSGVPLALYQMAGGGGRTDHNALGRTGVNQDIPYDFTAVTAPNGEVVVAPNCLQCHAQVFEGKVVVGLGNAAADFSQRRFTPQMVATMEQMLKATAPKQYEAAEPFIRATKAIGDRLITQVRGVNPAVKLTAVLAAHRDPVTLRWSDSALMPIPEEVAPTDVPAWWLLKRKHAMFHTGLGRGDFGRFLMASNLLTASDTAEANEVDHHFNDVLAYINSLQPPKYPHSIDASLARAGREIFVQNCSACHGRRQEDGSDYPNLLIPAATIKTDSLAYATYYQQNDAYVAWGNKSWFTSGDHPARLVPFRGYVAPPLDGVWMTAPYFHNGSVPTLEGVLNSQARPKYWSRDFEHPSYDYTAVGWHYTAHDAPGGNTVYNTTLPGYGNQGHEFGDHLTAQQRAALIEYLKTL